LDGVGNHSAIKQHRRLSFEVRHLDSGILEHTLELGGTSMNELARSVEAVATYLIGSDQPPRTILAVQCQKRHATLG